ncbi:MAG TPA: thioesterase family protein [Chitinophagaceae bacterium]|nr:thioesterase family protein [Chitinophagaceae bacterium]
MPRIKILLPDTFSFSTSIPLRITDVNYGGHVGNVSILSIIHEVRMQFFKKFGFTEMEFGGVSLIMSDVAIEFKNEVFYGDVLTAFVSITDFNRVGFEIIYKLIKTNSEKEMLVAVAKTGMVCFDYTTKKIVSVPEKMSELFS